MSDERDFDRIARAWLELGTNEAPDRAVSAVLQAVETTPQVRPLSTRLPWRYEPVNRMPIAAALVVALVIVVGGLYFMRSDGSANVGGPSPSASALPSAPASTAPSPTASAAAALPESIKVTPEAAVAVPGAVSIASDGQRGVGLVLDRRPGANRSEHERDRRCRGARWSGIPVHRRVCRRHGYLGDACLTGLGVPPRPDDQQGH